MVKTHGEIGLLVDILSRAAACDSSATNTVVSFFLFQVSAATALSATQSSRMSTRLLIDGFIFTAVRVYVRK